MDRNYCWLFCKIIILSMLLTPCSLYGQEDLLGQLRQKISEIESYRANFTLSQDSGEISFKKNIGFKVVMESQSQGKTIIIRTPDVKWTYIPSENKAYKIDIKSLKEDFVEDFVEDSIINRFDLRGVFSNIRDDTIVFDKTDILNGENVYIFEGFSKAASANQDDLEKYQVWISTGDGLLRKRIIIRNGEELQRLIVQSITFNLDISDDEFYFLPDSSVDVIESTEEWRQNLLESAYLKYDSN